MKLIVDGVEREITANWTIHFVENPLIAVLYFRGKRVTKPWSIKMDYEDKGDPYENANTADI